MKNNKISQLHKLIIILGTIFISLSAFHSNIWFDEAYTVGIVERTFTEIWNITGNDVHPVLYYWILKIISLITTAFGVTNIAGKIIVYRMFSLIPMIALGILGYTHIRKDFDEKVGIIFSFLVFFLPECVKQSVEIRMYSCAILAVTVTAIYAYRLRLTENSNVKNWLIFFIASISSIFLHYYGLMTAGLINLVLLYYLIKNKRLRDIIIICALGLVQMVSYIPWLMYLAKQLSFVSSGYWIKFIFPDTLIELTSIQFFGNLNPYVSFVMAIGLYIYLIIKCYKYKGNKNSIYSALALYFFVIYAAVIITMILHSPILYYRYLFVITGLYIFAFSFILSKETNPKIICSIITVITIVSTFSNITQIDKAYDKSNSELYEYLNANIKPEDTIIYHNIDFGSIISVYFQENQQYFYNTGYERMREAYKAFGPNFETELNLTFMEKVKGRTWIIDAPEKLIYNELLENVEYTIIDERHFELKYFEIVFDIILVEIN